jgi:hypothetical protein
VRSETNRSKLEAFLAALGERVRGEARVYLTGGATALLEGWRETTIDVDLKAEPEPAGLFEAIAALKEELNLNVELASPDDFIPPLPGWRERSIFISRKGRIDFFHYDPYSQALSKIERRHARDLDDVNAMLDRRLVEKNALRRYFEMIESDLIRYPAIDPPSFRNAVMDFCGAHDDHHQ